MKKMTVSLITIMTSLALTSPLYAATDYQNSQKSATTLNQSENSQINSQALSASKLLGMDIVSQNGEDIGEIQDIKLDPKSGRINYVTIQKGGVLGIGEEEGIAVPLEAFNFTEDKAKLLVDQNKLDTAPKQADMNDNDFRRDLDSHYGISPAWDERQGQQDSTRQMNMNMDSKKGNMSDQHSKQQ